MNKSIIIVFALFLAACGGSPKVIPPTLPQCEFLPPEPQPAWVSGDSQIEGYYTGVGDSDARSSSNEATQIARQRALANLSSSIKTNVSQQLSIEIKERSGQQTTGDLSKELANETRSITENLIKDSVRDDIWLDRDACRLWMRMKVAKAGVEKIQAINRNEKLLKQARALYQEADDRKQVHVKRLESIEEAIRLLERVDFSLLPLEDRDDELVKFKGLQTQIVRQARGNELIVVTLSEDDLLKSAQKEIAYRVTKGLKKAKHLYPTPCKERDDCLALAQDLRAKRLVIITVSSSVSISEMGGRVGELNVGMALFDVARQRQISQITNQKGQVLSFDKNLPWNQAIDRLFDQSSELKELVGRIQNY